MTDREKLIDLLMQQHEKLCDDCMRYPVSETAVFIADYLLANGVTFAKDKDVHGKWISVEDKLPKLEKYKISKVVLAYIKSHGLCFALRYDNGKGEKWFSYGLEQPDITHWMPLPEPPME